MGPRTGESQAQPWILGMSPTLGYSWYHGCSFLVLGTLKKLSYQSTTDIRSKNIFWLVYGRCITAVESGIKLVSRWYYLEYLPDW
jgi:hypothetical protein